MGHYKNKKGEFEKTNKRPRPTDENKKVFHHKNNFNGEKPKNSFNGEKKFKYTNVKLKIAYQNFYGDIIDSLYNLMSTIPFDKVTVAVKMLKPDMDRPVAIGEIVKFNNDNSITVRVTEGTAKYITDKHVISIKCERDYKANEITRVNEFIITDKFLSVDAHYADIQKAFIDTENECDNECNTEDVNQED
jgi:hypothetical protein